MGHFSQHLLPGGHRIDVHQDVEEAIPPLSPADVKNGNALSFLPCEADAAVQKWTLRPGGNLVALGTDTCAVVVYRSYRGQSS